MGPPGPTPNIERNEYETYAECLGAWFEPDPCLACLGGYASREQWSGRPCSHAHRRFGEKIDKAQGKLTLKHGPLENLGMPGMTMVFRVQDANWLDQVKPGDTIRFLADRVNGVFTVTRLEVAQP